MFLDLFKLKNMLDSQISTLVDFKFKSAPK